MLYGESKSLSYEVLPNSATIKPMAITVYAEDPILAGGKVVEILADGSLRAIGGGTAVIQVCFMTTLW